MITSEGARERLLDIRQAAEYVGLSYSHFKRHYRAWHIPFIKIGRKVLFRPAHLDGFLKRHTELG